MEQQHYYLIAIYISIGTILMTALNFIMALRQNVILATLKKEMAELELRIIEKLNATYLRTEIFNAKHEVVLEKLRDLEVHADKRSLHTDGLIGGLSG